MALPSEKKRSCDIRLRLTEDVYDRLDRLSERMGMPPSTLACYAVGDYIKRQEDSTRAGQMALMNLAKTMAVQLDDVDLEAVTQAAIAAQLRIEQQRQEGGGEKPADQ